MKGNFQIVVVVIFFILAIFGVLVFSGAIPIGEKNEPGGLGTVTIWGTERSGLVNPLLEEFNKINTSFVVKYEEKSVSSFDKDLLEALSESRGPDLLFLPDNLAFHYINKLFSIPYASYPLASFRENFAGAGEVFLTSAGVLAFPLTIDPLIMYYNRTTLDANGIVSPPTYWEELVELVPKLTKKDETNKISKSAVAMGQFSNVNNAKDILATLFMQTGNKIVESKGGIFRSTLNNSNSRYDLAPALQFFTDFVDPSSKQYSWNRSFRSSTESFSAEDLAFYFGFGSELGSFINKNPNQNFAVATFPQVKENTLKSTGARVTGVAVLASSKNFNTALTTAGLLATTDFASKFANALGVVPARRDLLKIKPTEDLYLPTLYNSAIFAKSWLDPSPNDTYDIFNRMVEGVLSNILTEDQAILEADSRLNSLLIK